MPTSSVSIKKIKFFIYTLPHRHTTNQIPFRRPHAFDPLGPRRNLAYHLCSVFRFFIQSSPHTFYPSVRISHHWLALMRHRQFLVFLYYWQMKRQSLKPAFIRLRSYTFFDLWIVCWRLGQPGASISNLVNRF